MYKLEMHLHTLGKSPCAKVDETTISELYSEAGYDGIICTNHYISELFRSYYCRGTSRDNALYYVDGYYTLKEKCADKGIDVFFGMELNPDAYSYYKPNPPHAELLIYGIEPDFVVDNPDLLFRLNQKELFQLSKECDWILAQSHPFRPCVEPLNPRYLEAVEVLNGHPYQTNNNEKALAMAEKYNLLHTAGSDFHFTEGIGGGVLLENPVGNNAELVKELRRRKHSVF